MAGTLRVGGKVLATHDSGTDEISLDSATNTSNMSFDANHAGIKTALNASGDAPIYACRAWVHFDGTTNTAGFCTILDSGNVSSISDNGTSDGDYTINFSMNMPHANYSLSGMFGVADPTSSNRVVFESAATARTVSSVRVRSMAGSTATGNAVYIDGDKLSFSIFC